MAVLKINSELVDKLATALNVTPALTQEQSDELKDLAESYEILVKAGKNAAAANLKKRADDLKPKPPTSAEVVRKALAKALGESFPEEWLMVPKRGSGSQSKKSAVAPPPTEEPANKPDEEIEIDEDLEEPTEDNNEDRPGEPTQDEKKHKHGKHK